MSERVLVDFREDGSVLDMATDQRMRQRIAELTRNQPDADGEWPFRTEPVPLQRGERDWPGREVTAPAAAVVGAGAHRSRRLMAVAAAVLAVVLVGGALVVQFSGTDSTTQFGGESIESMAVLAGQQPDHPLGPGEYLHQTWEELSVLGVGGTQSFPVRVDRWTAADGTGREVRSYLNASSDDTTLTSPNVDVFHDQPGSLRFSDISYSQLRELPDDPSALLAEVATVLGTSQDKKGPMASAMAELLMIEAAPPEVREAAFRALGTLGAESRGPMTDRAGRSGVGFAIADGDQTTLLIVDQHSTAMLERRWGSGVQFSTSDTGSIRTMLSQEITHSTG